MIMKHHQAWPGLALPWPGLAGKGKGMGMSTDMGVSTDMGITSDMGVSPDWQAVLTGSQS